MRYRDKWPIYAKQWDTMVIKPTRIPEFKKDAEFAIANKAIYQRIEAATGVEWYHVALIHRRESDADFNTYLGNGQSLAHKTTEVPAGRGPFLGKDAFYNGAIDALKLDKLDQVVAPWPIEKILFYSEEFNGEGYDMHGIPSPYLWGGTNIQVNGKYVKDGVFDANELDPQPGCAPMLWMIGNLDPTLKFEREVL
jgi:lysozyme family protein